MQMAGATGNKNLLCQIQALKDLVVLDQKVRNLDIHKKKMESQEMKHLLDANVTHAVKCVVKALPAFDGGFQSATDSMEHWLKECRRTDREQVVAKMVKLYEMPERVKQYAGRLAQAAAAEESENKKAFDAIAELDPGSTDSEAARNTSHHM